MPDEAVITLLAGPVDRVNVWYSALMADARFRVQSFATDADDVSRKLAGQPEVIILDAAIFPGPPPLIDLLTRVSGTAYVLLPFQADEATKGAVAGLPCVKGLYQGDVNLAELAGKIYADALARRQIAPGATADWRPNQSGRGNAFAGLRIIAVWNQTGGCGKTLLAAGLAYEAARRGLKTLLIGLGAPDVLPLTLGLQAAPNIAHWRAHPSAEAFKAALQRVGDLDVLAGFPDVLTEGQALAAPPEAKDSVTALVMQAAYAGYAIIVLDAPHSPLAAHALSAANALLLVARPTFMDAWCSVEAFRSLQKMQGQHRIAAENVLVALNRLRPGTLSAAEWHSQASQALKRAFPAVIATFPENPEIEAAQNDGKPAALAVDNFARPLHALADTLLGGTPAAKAGAEPLPAKKAVKLGPLNFNLK